MNKKQLKFKTKGNIHSVYSPLNIIINFQKYMK